MGTRILQFLLIFLLTGCMAWASAIFFGPWALKKYLESQAGDAVEVSGLRVTPKLAVTASRVQMSDAGAVTTSLRGVEFDWRLLTGDKPAIHISVSNGSFAGSLSVEDLQVTVTQAETAVPLKILGTAARAWSPNSVSATGLKFEALTDYKVQFLRRVTATTGGLTTQYLSNSTASSSRIEVDQVDLSVDFPRQELSGTLALTNVVVAAGPELSMPEVDVKFALADSLLTLSLGASDLFSETAFVAARGLTASMDYDAAGLGLAGPIELALNDFSWKDIRLPAVNAKVTLGDERFMVSVEGTTLGTELTFGNRYIGRAPDASFAAKFDASSLGDNLLISGEAMFSAAQQPVELDLSYEGAVANVGQFSVCAKEACEISDVYYEYNFVVAGEKLSGTSRCQEPTCLLGGRAHDLSTTDTNKFFANLQSLNLINPLVLGVAYAQMLQGVAVGAGHKINF